MPPPSKERVEVATSALLADAQTWRSVGGSLDAAARTADGLDFQAFHFSYLGDVVGLTHAYGQVQEKITRLLHEGAANAGSVADALTKAAQDYQLEDRNAEHRVGRVY